MKKKFIKPKIEFIDIKDVEIICTSNFSTQSYEEEDEGDFTHWL